QSPRRRPTGRSGTVPSPASQKGRRRSRASGSLHQPDKQEQYYRADRRRDDLADNAAAEAEAEKREEPSGDQRADHAEYEIADEAEAAPAHQLAGNPSRDDADDDENDNC